jgi:hypothetical protein
MHTRKRTDTTKMIAAFPNFCKQTHRNRLCLYNIPMYWKTITSATPPVELTALVMTLGIDSETCWMLYCLAFSISSVQVGLRLRNKEFCRFTFDFMAWYCAWRNYIYQFYFNLLYLWTHPYNNESKLNIQSGRKVSEPVSKMYTTIRCNYIYYLHNTQKIYQRGTEVTEL